MKSSIHSASKHITKLERAKQLSDSGANVFSKERLMANEKDILKETRYLGLTNGDIDKVFEIPSDRWQLLFAEAVTRALKEFEKAGVNNERFWSFELPRLSLEHEETRTLMIQRFTELHKRLVESLESMRELYDKDVSQGSNILSSNVSLADAFMKGALVSLAITNRVVDNILSSNMEILQKYKKK